MPSRVLPALPALLLACATFAAPQAVPEPPPGDAATSDSPISRQQKRFRKATPPGAPAAKAGAKQTSVPPGTPVVTLEGVCKPPAPGQAKGAVCRSVITKEDLDRFTKSFTPEMGDSARGRVAVQYAKTVAFSQLAEQIGLDKDPLVSKEIEYQLRVIRMRVLASAYMQTQLQKIQIGEADIQKYYDEHRDQYEQVQVRRLAVPFLVPTADGHPLDHAAMMAEMTELQKRAAAGEDMDQLQQEAFKALNIQAPAPPVVVRSVRRGTLQGDEAKVFEMKPGEISPVIEAAAALAIVKIESKDPTPISAARPEIEAALRRGVVQNELTEAAKKVHAQFNLPYLELTAQPNLFSVVAAAPVTDGSAVSKVSKPQQ